MVVDRAHREVEPLGDQPAGLTGGGQLRDLTFAIGERHDGGDAEQRRRPRPFAAERHLLGADIERGRPAWLLGPPPRVGAGGGGLGGQQQRAEALEALGGRREPGAVVGDEGGGVLGPGGDQHAVGQRRQGRQAGGGRGLGAEAGGVMEQPGRGGEVARALGLVGAR